MKLDIRFKTKGWIDVGWKQCIKLHPEFSELSLGPGTTHNGTAGR